MLDTMKSEKLKHCWSPTGMRWNTMLLKNGIKVRGKKSLRKNFLIFGRMKSRRKISRVMIWSKWDSSQDFLLLLMIKIEVQPIKSTMQTTQGKFQSTSQQMCQSGPQRICLTNGRCTVHQRYLAKFNI